MIIFPKNGLPPVNGAAEQQRGRPVAAGKSPDNSRHFDQITLSSRENLTPFLMVLKSKLVQEVRTTTPVGTLTALHQKIQSGEYQVDPEAIARKMLLQKEV